LTKFTSVIVHADPDGLLDSAHDVVDIRRRRRCRSRLLLLTVTSVDDHLETATGLFIVLVIQNGAAAATTTTSTGVSMTTKLEYGARGVGITIARATVGRNDDNNSAPAAQSSVVHQ
jgi:hypothetical protein